MSEFITSVSVVPEFITVTAVDKHSSDSTSRSFTIRNEHLLKEAIEDWENELSYRRYELTTQDDIDDYPVEIQTVLNELEITN